MKKINRWLWLPVFALGLVSNSFSGDVLMGKHNASAHQDRYLFVQSANKISIKIDAKHDKQYTITLTGVAPYVGYFSDRPVRRAGSMSAADFMKFWRQRGNNSFQESSPNANLSAVPFDPKSIGTPLNFAFQLMSPQYNNNLKTMTYTAVLLEGNMNELKKSTILYHATLFIDDACLSCWGG